MDLQSIQSIYSVLLPAPKIWLFESSSASLLVKAVAKERKRAGLPLLPLGPAFNLKLSACSWVCTSSQTFFFWPGPCHPGLTWLLTWPQTWFIMTDLLADQWPEADPDHCLQTCSWSGLTNTTSWQPRVRQDSCLCCHPQLLWSMPSLVEQPACTASSIVPVILQSSPFQMQKLLGLVKYVSMSAKPGQERWVLSRRYFQNSKTLYVVNW